MVHSSVSPAGLHASNRARHLRTNQPNIREGQSIDDLAPEVLVSMLDDINSGKLAKHANITEQDLRRWASSFSGICVHFEDSHPWLCFKNPTDSRFRSHLVHGAIMHLLCNGRDSMPFEELADFINSRFPEVNITRGEFKASDVLSVEVGPVGNQPAFLTDGSLGIFLGYPIVVNKVDLPERPAASREACVNERGAEDECCSVADQIIGVQAAGFSGI